MLQSKPKTCEGCPLFTVGKGYTNVEGTGSLPTMIVGEASGYNEALQSLPFVASAQAGSALQRAINMTTHSRSEFSITNCIRCHPPSDHLVGASYEYEALAHCRQYLDKAVQTYRPKVLLALGATAFRNLTGLDLPISQVRGYVFRASRYPDVLVLGSLHPSYIRRGNMRYLQLLLRDIHKATLIAQGRKIEGRDFLLDPMNENFKPIESFDLCTLRYQTNPTIDDATYFLGQVLQNPQALLTYDIETETSIGESEDELEEYGSRISQIQFCLASNSGIALPMDESFREVISSILSSPNPKAGHNVWRFDNPILRRAGFNLNGRIDDTMWAFHHFKADLPLGLQQVAQWYGFKFAWKHYASQNLPFYGIADVDSVQLIMNNLPQDMKQRGLWGEYNQREGIYKGYEGLVYVLNPILEKISERGIPINRKKQEEFSKEIDLEKIRIEDELKPLIPEKLLKIHPVDGYVREPKEVQEAKNKYQQENVESIIATVESLEVGQSTEFHIPSSYIASVTGLSLHTFKIKPPKPRKKKGEAESFSDQLSELEQPQLIEVERWCKILPFNPNSADQISNYIKHIGDEAKAKKAMTRLSKEKPADSENGGSRKKNNLKTSAEVLKRLFNETGNKVYNLILKYKGLTKMQGTYCGGEYLPKEDSRIHTEFSFRPATLQLSSRKPNVQNSPQHSKLAAKFLRTMEAREGYSFIKADMKSFHATMVGWLAKDKDYIRLCRLDIHSYVTSHMAQLPEAHACIEWDDADLGKFLKGVKTSYGALRNQAKRCIAEGQLVLTNKGLVPIEAITLEHLLWDGVEWVEHEGLIYQGEKEVITYDGLTATSDHIIYTESGEQKTLGQAASNVDRLKITGIEGKAIWSSYRDLLQAIQNQRLHTSKGAMRELQGDQIHLQGQSFEEQNQRMFKMSKEEISRLSLSSPGSKIRFNSSEMSQSFRSWLSMVWSERNKLLIHQRIFCYLYNEGASSSNLQRDRDRQDQQRWTLREGKSETSDSKGTTNQSPEYSANSISRTGDACDRFQISLQPELDLSLIQSRLQWRSSDRAGQNCYGAQGKRLEEDSSQSPKVRVYDILNAGPRHRFTVSGKLVHNCILGIPYGLGENGCYERFRDDFNPTPEEAQKGKRKVLEGDNLQKEIIRIGKKRVRDLYDLLRRLFPKVFKWQMQVKKLAHDQGYLQSPFGARREFACVLDFKYTSGGREILEQKNGEDAEKAASMLPQVNSFAHIRETLLIMNELGYLEKYGLINTVHDDLRFECKDELIEEALPLLHRIMSRESKVLVDDEVGAFYCDAEFKVGKNFGDYNDDKEKGELNLEGLREVKI